MSTKPFRRKPLVITFPKDHELEGLEVLARRPSIRAIEAVSQINTEDESTIADQVYKIIDGMFAPALVEWNYHDEAGEPVPADAEGLRDIDVEALLYILNGWTEGASAVDPNLGKESGGGHSSPGRLLDGVPTVLNPELSSALRNLPMHSVS